MELTSTPEKGLLDSAYMAPTSNELLAKKSSLYPTQSMSQGDEPNWVNLPLEIFAKILISMKIPPAFIFDLRIIDKYWHSTIHQLALNHFNTGKPFCDVLIKEKEPKNPKNSLFNHPIVRYCKNNLNFLQAFNFSGVYGIYNLSKLPYNSNLTYLNFADCESQIDLSYLCTFINLTYLDISNNNFSRDLEYLTKLKDLQFLNISQPSVYYLPKYIQNIKSISLFTNLKSLNLSGLLQGDYINEHCLKYLSTLTSLTLLKLERCEINDDHLNNLSLLTKLNTLSISKCYFLTNNSLQQLTPFINLISLDYGSYTITDIGLQQLSSLTNMTSLDLKYALKITDICLQQLHLLTNINSLAVPCSIGRANLITLPKLTSLQLKNLSIIDPYRLYKLTNIKSLHIDKFEEDLDPDKALRILTDLIYLTSLSIEQFCLDDKCLDQLTKFTALTLLKINHFKTEIDLKKLTNLYTLIIRNDNEIKDKLAKELPFTEKKYIHGYVCECDNLDISDSDDD